MTDDQNERASPHTPLGAALIYAQKRIEALEAENAALKAIQADEGEMLTIAWMDGAHRAKQNHRERITALEAENARLREALVQHNDRLRSAAQVAARDGQDTNWKTFRGQITYTLAEYHDLVIAARAALGASHEHG